MILKLASIIGQHSYKAANIYHQKWICPIMSQSNYYCYCYHFTALCLGLPGWLSYYQKRTFTHSHLSWSSIILYLLPPSTTIN